MALLIEKHERQLTTTSEPTGSPHHDELMDIDVSPSSDGHASQGLLPFPGNIVNGAHEVAHHNLTNLSCTGLWELCNTFRLAKTGNKTTLTDWLKNFSADRQGWDDLLAGTRKKHRGPQDGGVTKSTKGLGKKASTKKWLTLRHELLFSAAAASTGSTTQPCLPTERLKDMPTTSWRATHTSRQRSQRTSRRHPTWVTTGMQRAILTLTRGSSNGGELPHSISHMQDAHAVTMDIPVIAVQLQLQLQQVQAQLAVLMAAIAGGNSGGVAPSPVTVVSAPAPAPAHRGPGTMDSAMTTTDTTATTATTTDGPSPPTSSHQQPPTPAESVLQGPLDYLKLGNGRSLCFEKQSVPDPPLVLFTKDLPQLMRTWDDSSPEWTPSEAVLRIQGEPIALKHWPTVYRYSEHPPPVIVTPPRALVRLGQQKGVHDLANISVVVT
ncbi:hypothetical protein EDB89DRAFT_1915246 [Lactarius sanguifluus]|nr:hypothetical protein EDB89DRAFT_1915246 [Lactarius sanguifluus]